MVRPATCFEKNKTGLRRWAIALYWRTIGNLGGGAMQNDSADKIEEAVFETLANESAGPSKNERQWAMGCHLVGLCGLLIPNLILGLVGTLVLWLVKRDDGAFIDEQGKEALNFQITLLIYLFACFALSFIAIGLLLLLPLGLFAFVCIIVAAVKVSDGISFRYPACIRLIK